MKKILLISGSLREKSINTALLHAFENELKDIATISWGNIHLPLFNEELENDYPDEAQTLKQQIIDSDIVIISTPEYNRGMSGALKNAIDWSSRPYGKNAWPDKKVLVVSASPGGIAGALAAYQVKQSLLHLDARLFGQPDLMLGNAYEKFNESGILIDEPTKQFIQTIVDKLLQE